MMILYSIIMRYSITTMYRTASTVLECIKTVHHLLQFNESSVVGLSQLQLLQLHGNFTSRSVTLTLLTQRTPSTPNSTYCNSTHSSPQRTVLYAAQLRSGATFFNLSRLVPVRAPSNQLNRQCHYIVF